MSKWNDFLKDCQNATITTVKESITVGDLNFDEIESPVAADLQYVKVNGNFMELYRKVFLVHPNKLKDTINQKFLEAFDNGGTEVVAIRIELHGYEDEEGEEFLKTYIILKEELLFQNEEE